MQTMTNTLDGNNALNNSLNNVITFPGVKVTKKSDSINYKFTDEYIKEKIKYYFDGRVEAKKISKKTSDDYRRHVLHFFNKYYGINDISDIDTDLLKSVDIDTCMNYYDCLINEGMSIEYIRGKIQALKSFYKFIINMTIDNSTDQRFLYGNPFDSVSVKLSEVQKKEHLNESKNWGSLTREEVSNLIKVGMMEYRELYELASITGIRIETLRTLNINNDFKMINGEWCICDKWDKRRYVTERVGNELYEKLLAISDETGRVFSMGEKALRNNFKKDCEKIGISREQFDKRNRNLSLHSFKKAAGYMTKEVTNGDIDAIADKLHHNNYDNVKKYLVKEYDPLKDPSNKFDIHGVDYKKEMEDTLKQMDKDMLIDLIMRGGEAVQGIIREDLEYKKVRYREKEGLV